MSWFKYLKQNESINSSTINNNYSYPYLRRKIKDFTPLDNITEGSLIFINIKDLNIDKYINSFLANTSDESSYLVVYQNKTNEYNIQPVKSVINNNFLYFQVAENHNAGIKVENTYYIYYKTPNLRYIKSVNNGGVQSYQLTSENLGEYHIPSSQIDLSSFDVNLTSSSFYNFSFNSHWENGVSKNSSASVTLTFTGPNIYLYGDKGSNFGKIKLTIFSLEGNNLEKPSLVLDSQIIDCYSSSNSLNQILFQKQNLDLRDYNMQIEVLDDKNILSSDNKIKLNSYSFTYNLYLETDLEEITNNAAFVVFGGVR